MPAKLDQHFLVDDAVADTIVAASGAGFSDTVVEIGPGRGVLTERLLAAGARVTAVEYDGRLAAGLRSRFAGRALDVVEADFLRLGLSRLPSPALIVANLPYSVGTLILRRLLDWPGWEQAVLMFQKEVAARILAGAGEKPYGLLSLSVRLKADAAPVCVAGPECFRPRPKVHSAVLRLSRLARPRIPDDVGEAELFRVARAAFSQRRKMAAKVISSALGLPRGKVEAAFTSVGVPLKARAETISLGNFVALARLLVC